MWALNNMVQFSAVFGWLNNNDHVKGMFLRGAVYWNFVLLYKVIQRWLNPIYCLTIQSKSIDHYVSGVMLIVLYKVSSHF